MFDESRLALPSTNQGHKHTESCIQRSLHINLNISLNTMDGSVRLPAMTRLILHSQLNTQIVKNPQATIHDRCAGRFFASPEINFAHLVGFPTLLNSPSPPLTRAPSPSSQTLLAHSLMGSRLPHRAQFITCQMAQAQYVQTLKVLQSITVGGSCRLFFH